MSGVRALAALIAAIFGCILAGCAHAPPVTSCVSFGGAGYCLQPPATKFFMTQSVELTHPQGVERLIVQVEVNDDGIKLAGVTPFGRRVLWAQFGAAGLLTDMPSDAALSAAHILVGLQLAFWPLERAQHGLCGTSARLMETADGTRRLLDGDTVMFNASCDGVRPQCRRAHLHYPTLAHSLSIETISVETPK
jgi:hypothetical protein